ncbi:MAG: HipA domain-containing protein [Bdellovibrio sp.]|nr:HipA domain-containing protein [Bdellovibrio sp.]
MNAKLINQIQIFKDEKSAGTLERTHAGCKINFTSEFKNTETLLTFKISTKNKIYDFRGAGLPPYFAGLLPEGLRLKALIKKLKTSPDDLFSLLVASGDETIGNIHFKSTQSEKTILEIPNDFKKLKAQLQKGFDPGKSSLAGVQDKISADRISLPINIKNKNKNYILKLASSEFPDIIANELACLKIAKSCGLEVNKAKIVKDKNNLEALLVERFDRDWDKNEKKIKRFHQEDACQFLDRYPSDKYIISFQEIADQVSQLCTSPEIEIINLMKLKAFSYLIGNGDLHAKNISLIQQSKTKPIQLTPFYDLVCTALYGDQKMALLFLGKNENLKRKNFIDFGLLYGVPQVATISMLDKLTRLFAKNYENIFSFPLAIEKETFLKLFFEKRLKHLSE